MLCSTDDRHYFAAIGDVHGSISAMFKLVRQWESEYNTRIDFILQVGDFEPHRSVEDLKTMDAPSKYKKLGDFPDFYVRKKKFTHPVWFIGGNHEPYGFLDLIPDGSEISPNCHYLGRVNSIELLGLKIVGVSGIYKEEVFNKKNRPSAQEIHYHSNSEYIGFLESEIDKALEYSYADVLLLHEWPQGVVDLEASDAFGKHHYISQSREVGNEYARLLVEALQPQLVLCGHMHISYRTLMQTPSGIFSKICCLANVLHGKDSMAIFRVDPDKEIIEVTD